MKFLPFLLNLPWTMVGLIASLASLPQGVESSTAPPALVFKVKSFWWYQWLPGKRNVRAMTNGNVVQLGPSANEADLKHELIHVEQYEREPLLHPILYLLQSWRYGYRQNKYEEEAYSKSGNRYVT